MLRARKIIETAAASNIIDMNNITADDSQSEIPSAIISADLKTLGKVMNINTTLAQIFGFLKATLLGVNVKGLQGRTVSSFHDQLLHEYISTDLKYIK